MGCSPEEWGTAAGVHVLKRETSATTKED